MIIITKIAGIIVEYNPFHYGHLHHLTMTKTILKPDLIVAVMSGNYCQRGEFAIVDKFSRTQMALEAGIDIVIELPFALANQSADYFAYYTTTLLNKLKVSDLCFGSESNDIELLNKIVEIQLQPEYDELVKHYLSLGLKYPDAMNKALSQLCNQDIITPNDLLGLSYLKAIKANNYPIKGHVIKRTNDFHSLDTSNQIISATALRTLIKANKNYDDYSPFAHIIKANEAMTNEMMFEQLRYKIMTTSASDLACIHLVEEGFENVLKKHILSASHYYDYLDLLSSKRYTKTRIQRLLMNVLVNYTKQDNEHTKSINYARVLGMSKKGQQHLKQLNDPTIITNYSAIKDPLLDIELKASQVYESFKVNPNFKKEYQTPVIIKK